MKKKTFQERIVEEGNKMIQSHISENVKKIINKSIIMKNIEKTLSENGYSDDGDKYEYKFTYPQLKVFAMLMANSSQGLKCANNKNITLELSQYDMFNTACWQMGRFFSDDATAEECMAHWNNIAILREEMDEHHLGEFIKLTKQFEEKKEIIKAKSIELYKFIEAWW